MFRYIAFVFVFMTLIVITSAEFFRHNSDISSDRKFETDMLEFNVNSKQTTISDFFGVIFNGNAAVSSTDNSTDYGCTTPGQKSGQCSWHGICNDNGGCVCDNGYTTHDSDVGCNYKQKSRVIAFLFSFFLGPEGGAGEWYLGNTQLALGQLLTTWVGLFGILILTCIFGACAGEVAGMGFGGLFGVLWMFAVVIWWFCDWIMIVNGQIKDGNGVDTYNDF